MIRSGWSQFVRLKPRPESLMGDSVKAPSDDVALRKWGPVVVEFGVSLAPNR
jgi:hypothetical protein